MIDSARGQGRSRARSSPSTRSSTRTTSARSIRKRRPADADPVVKPEERRPHDLRPHRRARSASRSVASRSSTGWTSTPPAAPCSPCSVRTGPASPRSSRSSPATTRPTRGEIVVDDVAYAVADADRQARDLGVAIIFQEFQDASTLTVAENISLGRIPNSVGVVDWRAVNRARAQDPRRARGRHRPGPAGRIAARRRAPDHRDRPGAVALRPAADPRRADGRALPPRGRDPVRVRPAAARPGRRDHLHHPPPRRGHGQVADQVQVLRDGNVALLGQVTETDRRAMIEAMIGRRMTEVGRARRRRCDPRATAPPSAGPAPHRARASQDVSRGGPPGEIVRHLRQARLRRRGGRRDGLRPAARDRRHAGGRRQGLDAQRTGRRRRGAASASCPPTARPAARSWSARRRERRGRHLAPTGDARAVHHATATEAEGLPALARQAVDPLAQRPAPGDGHAVGRQPAEGAAGRWLERSSQRPRPHRADPRRRRRRPRRTSIARSASSRPTGSRSSIATSDYEEAVQVADRVYVMSKGAIVAELDGRCDHDQRGCWPPQEGERR